MLEEPLTCLRILNLLRFEQEAKAQRIGLWAKPNPVVPWEWRKKMKRKQQKQEH